MTTKQPGEGVEESLLARIRELRAENERLLALNERLRQQGFAEAEKSERLQAWKAEAETFMANSLETWDMQNKEIERLRAGFQRIKDECGRVCVEYDICTHVSCSSSHRAWEIADAVLTGQESLLGA